MTYSYTGYPEQGPRYVAQQRADRSEQGYTKHTHTLAHRERKPSASVRSRSPSHQSSRDGNHEPLSQSLAEKYGPLVTYVEPDTVIPEDREVAVVHHRIVEKIPPSSVRSRSPPNNGALIRSSSNDNMEKHFNDEKAKYKKHKAKAAAKSGNDSKFDKDGGIAALVLIGAAGFAATKLITRNHGVIKKDRERSRSARRDLERSVSQESRRLNHERSREHRHYSDGRSSNYEHDYRHEDDHVHDRGRSLDHNHYHHQHNHSDAGYETDSDTISLSSVDTVTDDVRLKSIKRRQQVMAGFAGVAVANTARKIYQGVDKRKIRLAALKKGKITPAEEEKQRRRHIMNNAISMGVAGVAMRGALLKYRESKGAEAERAEYLQKRAEYVKMKEGHDERKRQRREMRMSSGRTMSMTD